MQLPLQIVQVGAAKVNRTEQTRDISSGGVCFMSHESVEVGGRIEYWITLSGSNPPVRIRCLGKVLRSRKPGEGQAPYEVAVTMERYQFMSSQDTGSFAAAS
jgi:hypothetical protein